ncbi:MAG TPA: hypothetical protein VLX29_00110, partial [Nitrospirota bacterium]|nr:hypothetical protein [Nitrospirota bacterium]
MLFKIALRILVFIVALLFSFKPLHAEYLSKENPVSVPAQLNPPADDAAQVEEGIDDAVVEKPYHIPMILNDSVENHLEYFKTRGRDVFQL